MYHNSLDPIMSITTTSTLYNTRNFTRISIHVPVGTTEASYRTFGHRGIYI